MTTLYKNTAGEVCLTLRGADEDLILTTVRGWPYWQRADVERDPDNPARCLSVTLIASQAHETVVREILKRSFGMVFPAEGGTIPFIQPAPPPRRRR